MSYASPMRGAMRWRHTRRAWDGSVVALAAMPPPPPWIIKDRISYKRSVKGVKASMTAGHTQVRKIRESNGRMEGQTCR